MAHMALNAINFVTHNFARFQLILKFFQVRLSTKFVKKSISRRSHYT